MTDLRDARGSRWLPPTVAAALILGVAALAVALLSGGHSPRAAAQASTSPLARRMAAAMVGPAWRLTRLRDGFGTMTVPAARNQHDTATLTFKPQGELDGNDGVNGIDARYRVTRDGYVVRGPVMVGGVGGLGGPADSPVARIEAAIDACFYVTRAPTEVTLKIRGNTMTLRAPHRTLTLVRTYLIPRQQFATSRAVGALSPAGRTVTGDRPYTGHALVDEVMAARRAVKSPPANVADRGGRSPPSTACTSGWPRPSARCCASPAARVGLTARDLPPRHV